MELSKKELQQIIVDAIHEDRNERDKQAANDVIERNDIESPRYNTNLLFLEVQREFVSKIETIEKSRRIPNGDMAEFSHKYSLCPKIKAVVFEVLGAKNSRYIEPGLRKVAIELYRSIANECIGPFNEHCQDFADKREAANK